MYVQWIPWEDTKTNRMIYSCVYHNLIHQNTQKDTINFVCYYYTRDVFSVISKFFIPFGKIFVRHFPCDVKYLSMQQHLLILVTTTTSVSNYGWPRSHKYLSWHYATAEYHMNKAFKIHAWPRQVAAKCHSLRSENLQICLKQWVERSLHNKISDCRVASQTQYCHTAIILPYNMYLWDEMYMYHFCPRTSKRNHLKQVLNEL